MNIVHGQQGLCHPAHVCQVVHTLPTQCPPPLLPLASLPSSSSHTVSSQSAFLLLLAVAAKHRLGQRTLAAATAQAPTA